MTRKELQNAFIVFAIDNQLVDLTTRCYNLAKFESLQKKLGVKSFSPSELFQHLQKVVTEL